MEKIFTRECNNKTCKRRNEQIPLEEFYELKKGKYGRRAICKKCYHLLYGKHISRASEKRKRLSKKLPNTLTEEQKELLYKRFNNTCALSHKKESVTLDHFIPISWGKIPLEYNIGGTTYENSLPLDKDINISKNAHNPFGWIKKAHETQNISMNTWNEVVRYMAYKNRLTVEAYENAVSACYEKVCVKRSIKSIRLRVNRNGVVNLNFIKQLLKRGINIEIAVDLYGSKKIKDFFKIEEVLDYIIEVKKEMAAESSI